MERLLNFMEKNFIINQLSLNFLGFYKKKKLISKLHQQLKLFFLKNEKLEFIVSAEPDISVILVLYNQAQFTLECLRLIQQQRNISYEIVIIDNSSSDLTHSLLSCCHNVVVVKNAQNVGFLQAANQGAQIAKGKNLLFLNNDIWQLNPDAFAIALSTLNRDSNVGAIGGKIILPNGSLQEAGVFVSQEGIHQYGRGKKPDIFEVNFQRHVDYCSGLFLLTPKHLFQNLGGFDERYSPAYCEDCDYCVRVNLAGFKVLYEPRIVVGHIEGGSAIKKKYARTLYKKNIVLFNKKHAHWLQTFMHLSDFSSFTSSSVLISRYHKRDCKRLLFIGNKIPSQHTLNLMKSACDAGHAVSFYPLNKLSLSWDKIYSLFDTRIEVCNSLERPDLDNFISSRRNYYNNIVDENGNGNEWVKYSPFLTHLL
ncbi:glycosyl transferase family protein [Legionella sainthelensi]|uniref:Glycosyl transferase family protein n=1 Tax=Legionella sainthelensi TaxID=28087 RepID=A0A0W0YEG4_9GAMM|nr:glycosyltransferase family 2 protein [Legionella sainthelensi]KTD55207.1 glycosyl transferase family protein [Legionella sainthelensi]